MPNNFFYSLCQTNQVDSIHLIYMLHGSFIVGQKVNLCMLFKGFVSQTITKKE